MVFTMGKNDWQSIVQSCCNKCPVMSMETCDQCPVKMYGDLLKMYDDLISVRVAYGAGSTEEENKTKLFRNTMSSKENMGRQL